MSNTGNGRVGLSGDGFALSGNSLRAESVDDGEEFDLDDDCDDDPDHVDGIFNEGLCDQAAYVPQTYERQACTCGQAPMAGWLGWLALGGGWLVRRR